MDGEGARRHSEEINCNGGRVRGSRRRVNESRVASSRAVAQTAPLAMPDALVRRRCAEAFTDSDGTSDG